MCPEHKISEVSKAPRNTLNSYRSQLKCKGYTINSIILCMVEGLSVVIPIYSRQGKMLFFLTSQHMWRCHKNTPVASSFSVIISMEYRFTNYLSFEFQKHIKVAVFSEGGMSC